MHLTELQNLCWRLQLQLKATKFMLVSMNMILFYCTEELHTCFHEDPD